MAYKAADSSPKSLSSIGVRRVNGIVGNTPNGFSEDAT